MYLSKYFCYFILYSFLGWIYESCYCTINEHSWQNRGFLYGPCVPIYGVGATVSQIIFVDTSFLGLQGSPNWKIFLICSVGSFFLEYGTSFVLEKRFHARWWDYSNFPLNINGRVCLLFTCCFGIAGVVIVNYVIPPISGLCNHLPVIAFELLSLIFMFIFGMDMALTVSALTSFAKQFERINEQINSQIAQKYATLETNMSEVKIAGIEKMEESKEALFVKKELTAEKLAELKEQLTVEYLTNAISNATATQLGQLRHIAVFRHPVASTKALMERGAGILKKKKDQPQNE